jgi:hypothetical protein
VNQGFFLIDVLARFEGVNEVVAVQVLRRGDNHGVDALVFQQAAIIVVGGRARDDVVRVIQALAVHVGESGYLNLWAGQRLMNQLRAALPDADDAQAHAVVRAQHPGR